MFSVFPITALIAWIRRPRALDAWLALRLLKPSERAAMFGSIAAFALAGFVLLLALKFTQDLYRDSAEAYAWGRQFLAGYGRHPPMTGWIAGLWYSAFPASGWASYLLSRVATLVSLTSIYLLTQRALGARHAALVVFAMMLYPAFIGVKSDRFNNYQVLLALSPLVIWIFLKAFEQRTARWGVALGIGAAAAALTIYSSALLLLALALAAIVHPARRQFFSSPTPYVAMLIFLIGISPHVVWLIKWNFAPFHWLESQAGGSTAFEQMSIYLKQNVGMIGIPVLGAAIALFPWRLKPAKSGLPVNTDGLIVVVIAAVLLITPPLAALTLDLRLKPAWGDTQFYLLPVAILILIPRLLITRLTVTRAAAIVAVTIGVQLVVAPIYAWENFKQRSDHYSYAPTSEVAREVTKLWRDRFGSPLPIVVAAFEIAAPVVFYSPDHPRMFADSPDLPYIHPAAQPAFSPWIDYPVELRRAGFVGICFVGDDACLAELERLRPGAEPVDLTATRQFAGIKGQTWKLQLRIAPPGL